MGAEAGRAMLSRATTPDYIRMILDYDSEDTDACGPKAAVHGQSPRFGAASALLPFVRLAEFLEDEGKQLGLSGF